jgi:hypothetical protein
MATYVAIATTTVGSSGSANIQFTSIPNNYTDLVIYLSARTTSTGGAAWQYVEVRLNGSTTSGTYKQLYANGSSAASGNGSLSIAAYANPNDNTTNSFATSFTYIPGYNSSFNKSISNDAATETNSTSALISFFATAWANTSAVTSITLVPQAGNFVQYTTATLYGISST